MTSVSLHLSILIAYSLALMALGVWIGRRVRGAGDFFVAGRRLGPGLLFAEVEVQKKSKSQELSPILAPPFDDK